jgi:hypothetical protein
VYKNELISSDSSWPVTGELGNSPQNYVNNINEHTASGVNALCANTTGNNHTASGSSALNGVSGKSTGSNNTAIGFNALYSYTTGIKNTASGVNALYSNSSGSGNDADGYGALYENTSGDYNTAVGYETLYGNTTGTENNATGYATLEANITGSYNNAMGVKALFENISGSQNSAVGYGPLYSNTNGNYNIALGYFAGFNLTTGDNNIDINNRGVAGESGVIRIGIQETQVATYIAGIYNVPLTGNTVVVTSSGQLGVVGSSERFKTAVAPMGSDKRPPVSKEPTSRRKSAEESICNENRYATMGNHRHDDCPKGSRITIRGTPP